MSDPSPSTLISKLTLDEKIALLSGDGYWHTAALPKHGIPRSAVADGPHGLCKQPEGPPKPGIMESLPATCFPTAAALACSWDIGLLESVGRAMGKEARDHDVALLLGPGLNIKRHPLGGRNFEYLSEDPYLSGTLAATLVRGIQSTGVGACLKHFVANNQEHQRQITDALIGQRALHEIYLKGFRLAIEGSRPAAIMAAYNKVNGTYCCEHTELLADVLRDQWGFDGLVVSDWGATNDRVASLRATMDLEMPGNNGAFARQIKQAISDGALPVKAVDDAAMRVLELSQRQQELSRANADHKPSSPEAHHALARHAAASSMVLLKHDPSLLPLAPQGSIAVIGAFARHPRIQGNGSSRVEPTQVETPWDALWERLTGTDVSLGYAAGYDPRRDELAPALIDEARQIAARADVVLLFVGLPEVLESEGIDRDHMDLPQQQLDLIDAIAAEHKRICVIIQCGSPIAMGWKDRVQAILMGYLGGQAAGGAIADVLFGDVTPGGKLAESFPVSVEDCGATAYFPGIERRIEHREDIFVGYRFYDSFERPVSFPFGYGLSYTSFAYELTDQSHERCEFSGDLNAIALRLTCRITNTGDVRGAEVIQCYVHFPESPVYREAQSLVSFARVELAPGEQAEVRLAIKWHDLAFYQPSQGTSPPGLAQDGDEEAEGGWRIAPGPCELRLGSSSRDIRINASIDISHLAPSEEPLPGREFPGEWSESGGLVVTDDAFASLLGRALPPPHRSFPFYANSTVGEVLQSGPLTGRLFGKALLWMIQREAKKALAEPAHAAFRDALLQSLEHTPLRSLVLMSEGRLRFRHLQAIIRILNGQWRRVPEALKGSISPHTDEP